MAGAGARLRSALARLWPEERIALVYLGALGAWFALAGLPFTVVGLLGYYGIFLGAVVALALPVWALARWRAARRGGPGAGAAGRELALLGRALVALLAVLVGYTNLKSRLFALHPALYDRELARLDAWLHCLGCDFQGWVLATTWSSLRMGLLDLVYFTAWLPLAIPFALAFARGGAPAARRFCAALGLVYLIGGFLYLAVPSLGPAFFERFRYEHLVEFRGWRVQQAMFQDLRRLAADPASDATAFFGIAAFPSLHLASTALGLFAAARWSRRWLWLLVPWNLAIAWSALAWGWHYAVDFYPGVLLAWLAWRVAGPLATPAPDAAAAAAGGGALRAE